MYNEFLTQAIQTDSLEEKKSVDLAVNSSRSGEALGKIKVGNNAGLVLFKGSWEYIDSSRFVYASSTSVTVNGIAVTDYFELGMRVRLVQTTTKYFVITDIIAATNTLRLTGGTDYTVANATITEIAVSTSTQPTGFPDFFNFTSTLTAENPLTISGSGVFSGQFRVEGIKVSAFMARAASTLGGSAGAIYDSLPLAATSTGAWTFTTFPAFVDYTSSTYYSNFVKITSAQPSRLYLNGLQNVGTGTMIYNANIEYLYSHT